MNSMRRLFAAAAAVALLTPPADAKPVAATPEAASKMIPIEPGTKRVEVFVNETVLFVVGNRQFAIKFDGAATDYDLQKLAPPGMLTHKVRVHVSRNPG